MTPLTEEELVAVFAEQCECRPIDIDRVSHSHDCGGMNILRAVAELRAARAENERLRAALGEARTWLLDADYGEEPALTSLIELTGTLLSGQ